MQASWDVSGDPCPTVKYEWAIRRLDGLEISSYLDMGCKLYMKFTLSKKNIYDIFGHHRTTTSFAPEVEYKTVYMF